jgi:hypothetical protein
MNNIKLHIQATTRLETRSNAVPPAVIQCTGTAKWNGEPGAGNTESENCLALDARNDLDEKAVAIKDRRRDRLRDSISSSCAVGSTEIITHRGIKMLTVSSPLLCVTTVIQACTKLYSWSISN